MFWIYRETKQEIFSGLGAMYTALLFLGPNSGNSVQPILASERTVFYRERAAGMYSAFPYAIAQVFIIQILILFFFLVSWTLLSAKQEFK